MAWVPVLSRCHPSRRSSTTPPWNYSWPVPGNRHFFSSTSSGPLSAVDSWDFACFPGDGPFSIPGLVISLGRFLLGAESDYPMTAENSSAYDFSPDNFPISRYLIVFVLLASRQMWLTSEEGLSSIYVNGSRSA
jgi:hypothetical protein